EKQGYTRFFEPGAGADVSASAGAEARAAAGAGARAAASPGPAAKKSEPAKRSEPSAGKKRSRKSPRTPEAPGVTLAAVQDRLRAGSAERGRIIESLESALRVGQGRVHLHVVNDSDPPQSLDCWRYSSELHCADCDLSYREPNPSLFSFNSPVGACEA